MRAVEFPRFVGQVSYGSIEPRSASDSFSAGVIIAQRGMNALTVIEDLDVLEGNRYPHPAPLFAPDRLTASV